MRAARFALLAPWLLVLAFAAGVCGLWAAGRAQVLAALERAPAEAAARGLKLTLGPPSVSGFPFRLRVRVAPVRLEAPGGWAAQAPELVAQAYAFAPRKWVFVAPAGISVTRPQGGAFDLRGQALRASVSRLGLPGQLTVLQADGAVLSPAAGAHTVALQSARRILLDARADGRPGETAALLQVEGGVATPESALWQVASGAPFDLTLSGRAAASGFALERLAGRAGPLAVSSPGGALQAGPDGRLEGDVPLRLSRAPGAPTPAAGTLAAAAVARGRAAGEEAALDLVFAGGKARLAPCKLGAAPEPASGTAR